MATITLRMMNDLQVKGARHQSIPTNIRLSMIFFKLLNLLRYLRVCLLSSDLTLKIVLTKLVQYEKATEPFSGPLLTVETHFRER
jgi:hypothetical protein